MKTFVCFTYLAVNATKDLLAMGNISVIEHVLKPVATAVAQIFHCTNAYVISAGRGKIVQLTVAVMPIRHAIMRELEFVMSVKTILMVNIVRIVLWVATETHLQWDANHAFATGTLT